MVFVLCYVVWGCYFTFCDLDLKFHVTCIYSYVPHGLYILLDCRDQEGWRLWEAWKAILNDDDDDDDGKKKHLSGSARGGRKSPFKKKLGGMFWRWWWWRWWFKFFVFIFVWHVCCPLMFFCKQFDPIRSDPFQLIKKKYFLIFISSSFSEFFVSYGVHFLILSPAKPPLHGIFFLIFLKRNIDENG